MAKAAQLDVRGRNRRSVQRGSPQAQALKATAYSLQFAHWKTPSAKHSSLGSCAKVELGRGLIDAQP